VIADVAKALPFQSRSVDCVLAFEVLEHLSEPSVMLEEAFRVLRSNGTLMLSVPFQWWVHEEPWDFYRFTKHGLDYILRKSGFTVQKIVGTSGFWAMLALKLNYQSARFIRGPRILRKLVRAGLVPIWWTSQALAIWLDKWWPEDRETIG